MKKMISIFLALVMILSLNAVTFAEEEKTYMLTITGAAGHTYDIYQIYTGDVAEVNGQTVLSNVKYGKNHVPHGKVEKGAVDSDELNDLVNSSNPAAFVQSWISDNAVPYKPGLTPDPGKTTIEVEVPAGYYLIEDVTANPSPGETKSPIILQMLGPSTVASKHAEIVSEKKVDDKNDSVTSENGTDWQDSADYDIGDPVPFQLSVTLPATLNAYEEYELTFHDKLADGFTNPSIQRVYILKADGTTPFTIPPAANNNGNGYTYTDCTNTEKCELGGCSFNVKVGDIKQLYVGENAFTLGDKIIVEYTAALDGDAAVGRAGNENAMFVCHPDGHTPIDYVTVLTYALTVNKIDGMTKAALNGAGFTLYKWYASGDDTGEWKEVGDEIKDTDLKDTEAKFTWEGIDSGKYQLVETTTPAGYNTMADMVFTIDSNHKPVWSKGDGEHYNDAFLDLIAKDEAGNNVFVDAATVNGTRVEDGKLEGDIENYAGIILPETGAHGTMLLIGISSTLVAVAAIFMITRKKMSVYED